MFKVLILICAAAIDHAACTQQTATDVVRGPLAHTIDQCIKESQATLAQTSIAPRAGKEYMKVVCEGQKTS